MCAGVGSGGKFRKVPEGSGRFRKVPEGSGVCWQVPEGAGRFRCVLLWVPESCGGFRRVPARAGVGSGGKLRRQVPEASWSAGA